MIKDTIFENPIPLLSIKDSKLRKAIDDYLPYSSAFECECYQQSTFDIEAFKSIPDIMAVDCDRYEQRFRVPSGLKGLVCLYNICEQLKLNSELNKGSGIHYHTDCIDVWDYIADSHRQNIDWIYKELETWHPDYIVNKTKGWVRFNSLKTIEIRVGEMSFDYPILAKRMIHCNDIVRRFKIGIVENIHKAELEILQTKLKDMQTKKEEELPDVVYRDIAVEVVKSRTIKI